MLTIDKIRQMREERGYSLKELAKRAGISYSHLSEIERGIKSPSLKTLEKLAQALNIQKSMLVPEENGRITIGQKIRVVRESQGKKLTDLAQMAGVSLSYLSSIERGAVPPSIDVLKKITEALNISVVQLMSNERSLGQKLKMAREQLGLTQAEVAERAGVSPGLIGQIEQGKIQPSLRTIERIAEVIHTSPCYFILEYSGVEETLSMMSPELQALILEPKVQDVLRMICNLNEKELKFVFGMIRLVKQSHLDFA